MSPTSLRLHQHMPRCAERVAVGGVHRGGERRSLAGSGLSVTRSNGALVRTTSSLDALRSVRQRAPRGDNRRGASLCGGTVPESAADRLLLHASSRASGQQR